MRFNLSLHPIALTGNFLVTVIDLLIYPYWKNFQKKLVAKIEVPLFANVVYDSFLMHIPTSVWPHSTPCRIGHFSTKITAYRRLDNKPECEIWFKRMRQSTVVIRYSWLFQFFWIRHYLKLPITAMGFGNLYLLALSCWKVNIAGNPIAVRWL